MRNEPKYLQDFYIYELDIASIAGGASVTDSFNIQADASFRWEKATFMADILKAIQTDTSRVIPLVTVLVTDTGSGRQMMDAAVPISSLFGTGQIPFVLQRPKTFAARSTVSVQLTNYTASTAYGIRLSFIGSKVFNLKKV